METAFSNPSSIRQYFQKILELTQSGEQYPVAMSDVWPLAFERKDEFVRVLKKYGHQGVHYQVIRMSPEKSKGRPSIEYKLTVACLEFFIASRIPAIFDVYRQVFHQILAQRQLPKPVSPDELISILVQRNLDVLVHLKAIEQILRQITQTPGPDKELSQSEQKLPLLGVDSQIRSIVDEYAHLKKLPHQQVWRLLYCQLNYQYAINVSAYRLEIGESKLQALKRHGHLDKLYSIALTLSDIETRNPMFRSD
ncbi:hypothetical protein GCM10027592_03620 [Spirosoma flavus]